MKNVTISLDEALARWTRIAAAEREVSVSRFIAEILRERMRQVGSYERAMRSNLARQPVRLNDGGKYPGRNDLYDRPVLRR